MILAKGFRGISAALLVMSTFSLHAATPSASVSWSPSTVNKGDSSTLSWSSSNATECYLSGRKTSTSGSWVGKNRTNSQTTTFYCTGPGGRSSTKSARLTVRQPAKPTASISWSPSTIKKGESSTLRWSSSNATACYLSGSSRGTSGSWVGTNRSNSQTSSLYCTGPGGTSSTVSARLTVIQPPKPSASLSWSPSTVEYGQSSTLRWSSSNASNCYLNGGSSSTSGSWVGTNRTRSSSDSYYCTGEGGTSSTATATLTVKPRPKPTASVSWSPSRVDYGDSATLSWSSSNASTCYLNGNETITSGTWVGVNRTRNSTDSFYCTGPGGTSSTASANLSVNPPPAPTGTISWSPSTIDHGESSTLTWSSTDATDCTLDGVSRGASGTWLAENRTHDQVSTLVCSGPGGSTSQITASLNVIPLPVPTATVSWTPSTINYGESATLSWSSTEATTCYLNDNVSSTSGSWLGENRTRNSTDTYRCEGPGGTSNTATASLTVIPPPTPTLSISWSVPKAEYQGSATLSWTSSNADACYLDDIAVATSGSQTETELTSSITRTMYCSGIGGQSESIVVSLPVELPPVPTATISWTPSTVDYDGTSLLSWRSTNATSCKLGELDAAISGDWEGTNRTRTQTSTLICTGPGGTSEEVSAVLTVNPPPPPTLSHSFDNNNITIGDTHTESWSSTNTRECHNTSSKRDLGVEGSWTVKREFVGTNSPSITCTGLDGSEISKVAEYTVNALPAASWVSKPETHKGTVSFAWSDIENANYKIEKKEIGGDWQFVEFVTEANSYSESGLDNTKDYAYRITSCYNSTECHNSIELQLQGVFVPAPTLTFSYDKTELVIGGTHTATWTSTNTLECHNANDLDLTVDSSWTTKREKVGEFGSEVICTGEDGTTIRKVATYKVVALPAPQLIDSVAIQNGEFILNWTELDEENANYKIERKLVDGSWAVIETALNATTYRDSGLDQDKNYLYRVTSCYKGQYCENYDESEVIVGSALAAPVISNLKYTPTVGMVGHTQTSTFDYFNVTKCYAPMGYKGNLNKDYDIVYVESDEPISGTFEWTSGKRTEVAQWEITIRCVNAVGTVEAELSNRIELGVPVISDLAYTPNPGVIGQTQVFNFNYFGATKCYAPAAAAGNINENEQDIVYFEADGNTASSGSVAITTPVRTKPGSWEFQVVCSNEVGISEPLTVSTSIIQGLDTPELTVEFQNPSNVLNNDYRVHWTEVPEAVTYRLEASFDNGETWPEVQVLQTLSKDYSDPGPGKYIYRVTACDVNNSCSLPSTQKSINIQIAVGQCIVE